MTTVEDQHRQREAIQAISRRDADRLDELLTSGIPATYPMLRAALRVQNDQDNLLGMLLETDDLDDPKDNSKFIVQVIRDGQPGKLKEMIDSGFNFWGFDFDEVDDDSEYKSDNQLINRAVMEAITKADDTRLGAPYRDVLAFLYDSNFIDPTQKMGETENYAWNYANSAGFEDLKKMLMDRGVSED